MPSFKKFTHYSIKKTAEKLGLSVMGSHDVLFIESLHWHTIAWQIEYQGNYWSVSLWNQETDDYDRSIASLRNEKEVNQFINVMITLHELRAKRRAA